MRIAIVGAGISGLTAAYVLTRKHEVFLFEAQHRLGGHTHTIDVARPGGTLPVDTGFIVFNDWTYPNFIRLLSQLGVESQPSSMSFSVQGEETGLEYAGTSLDALFAQRGNAFNPRFVRMLLEIPRFNRETAAYLDQAGEQETLGSYLARGGYSAYFRKYFILPMVAAIWSAPAAHAEAFPLRTFIRFFHNHGMLSIKERPVWRVLKGGSRSYLKPITGPYADRIFPNDPVTAVHSRNHEVELCFGSGRQERFDAAVVATHSDEALRLLVDPTPHEQDILGAIPYRENSTVLHTDRRVLPANRRAWAAWNYFIPREERSGTTLSYNMNILQSLATDETYVVSLNSDDRIDPAKVIRRLSYTHPVYTPASDAARARRAEIQGQRRIWYCGAYWRFGFHEDGVVSALDVARELGAEL